MCFKKIYCLINGEDIEYFTNKSCIDDKSYIKSDSYIEYSTTKDCIIGEKCIISNSNLKNVIIPDGVCIVTLKLENKKYISLIYGIEDNPKDEIDSNTKFLNTVLEKSIEKYEILSEIIDDVKEYYQVLEYKRNLNNLYFLELVVSNLGNSHDELVDVSIQLPKDKLILSDEFPIPEYEFLEKFKGNIIPTLYSIKESYNTSKYSPDSIINTQNHIPTPSIPIMLGTYWESYESLKEDYLSEIDDYFDYELIEHKDMIVLKHSQKLIKAKENLLFPCRIFLKEPIEIIKYTISSKFNDKIIEREISIK